MPRQLGIKEAKQRAGRFCAFRERSPNELLEKLGTWGLALPDAMQVVAELSREGFIDEQRFANAYCNDKFEFNSWGRQKIRANIYVHKLSERAIEEALDRIDPEKYESRLFDLARQKWQKLEQEEPLKRKQKTVNYLANKGFELDLIWKMIGSLDGKSR